MRWAAVLVAAWGALLSRAAGDDRPLTVGGTVPRTLAVPADRPQEWPAGTWEPVPQETWERYLDARVAGREAVAPPSAFLQRATYYARLEETVLRGTCQFQIGRPVRAAGELVLHPLRCCLSDVHWEERPAVWGSRPDGRTVIWTDGAEETLTARWELSGERLFDRLEFQCEFPSALVCELTLDLPADLVLTSTAGLVTGPVRQADESYSRWTVRPGRRTDFKLICTPPQKRSARPVPVRETVVLTTQGEGVDAQYDFEFETHTDAPLSISVPVELQVLSAAVGNDAPLPVRSRVAEGRRIVTIDLPEPRQPRGARLRLRGFQPLDWQGEQSLPIPVLLSGEVLEQQVVLRVRPPLRLNETLPDGYRLTDRRTDADRTETWTFQALRSDPELRVRLATPPPELVVETVTWLDFAAATPRLVSRHRLRGGGGEAFQVRAEVSPEWDVVAVESVRGDAAALLAGYQFEPGPSVGQLTIDLRQSLDTEESVELLVTALGPTPRPGAPVRIPTVVWLDAVQQTGLLAVRGPAGLETSSTVPASPPTPTPEQSQWLAELCGGAQPALLLDRREIIRRPEPALLQFDVPTPGRDPLSELATASPAAPERSIPTGSPASAALPISVVELVTQLAPAGRREHWHEVRVALASQYVGECVFTLAETATLVEVEIDGQPTPLIRQGRQCRLAGRASIPSSMTIRYRTPAAVQVWIAQEVIPVPVFPGTQPALEWTVLPSPVRACAAVGLPFSRVREAAALPVAVRWLGPLARVPPASHSPAAADSRQGEPDAAQSTGGMSPATATDRRGILQVEAAIAPAEIRIQTWNPAITDGAAWAVLMLVLLVVVALRRLRSPRLNRLGPPWMAFLLLAAWAAPLPFARMAGGCLAATGLGIALPRRVVLGRSHAGGRGSWSASASPSQRSSQLPSGAVSAGIVLLVACLTEVQSQEAPPPTPLPPASAPAQPNADSPEVLIPHQEGQPTGTVFLSPTLAAAVREWDQRSVSPPAWLIRSARYDVALGATTTVTSRFEVLIRSGSEPAVVRFPLSNLTFETAASAQVDGQAEMIIPASSGEGFFIRISPRGAVPESPASGTESPPPGGPASHGTEGWEVHHVEVRGLTVAGVPPVPVLNVGIPVVADAQVRVGGTLPGQVPLVWRARGAISAREEGLWVHLGPRPAIEARGRNPGDEQHPPPFGSVIGTRVEVSPLRLEAQTLLNLDADATTGRRTWSIPLAANVVVTDVAGLPDLQWNVVSSGGRQQLQVMAGSPPAAPQVVTVRTVRGVDPAREPSHTVELRPVAVVEGGNGEWLRIRPATGFDLEVSPPAAVTDVLFATVHELPPELRSEPDDPQTLVCRLRPDQGIHLRLKPRVTVRAAEWRTEIEVDRGSADWRAHVRVDVSGAPTAVHEFQIDPRIRIESVAVLQDGADRLARFTRLPDRLQAVLTRPYLGTQEIELRGTFPVTAGDDVPFPTAILTGADVQSFAWEVSNRSGWELRSLPAPAGEAASAPAPPLPWRFSADDPNRPTGLRLLPGPDAASAELVTVITRRGEQDWWQRTIGIVRPEEAPLRTVPLIVPAGVTQLSVSPAADVVESTPQPDGSTRLALRPARLRNGSYRFVVESRLAVPDAQPLWELPALSLPNSSIASHLLLLDSRFPYRLTSASGEELDWERVPVRLAVVPRAAQFLPVRISTTVPTWTWTRFNPEAPTTRVTLLEHRLWWDAGEGVEGTTALTFVTTEAARLALRFPPPLVPGRITLGGVALPLMRQGDRVEFELPPQHRGPPLLVHWRADDAPLLQRGAAPLPEPVGWSPGRHVAMLIPAGASAVRLSQPVAPIAWHAARMAGLLEAVERQSSRTFALDNPLLSELRGVDAALDHWQHAGIWPDELLAEVRALRQRWQRIHPLIAVRVGPPGDQPASPAAPTPPDWSSIEPGPDVDLAILGPETGTLPLTQQSRLLSAGMVLGLFVGLTALLLWLQRRHVTDALADWLAVHPAVACLLLGSGWVLFLEPRAIGVVILVIGLTLLSRRPRPVERRPDTALVGPGR